MIIPGLATAVHKDDKANRHNTTTSKKGRTEDPEPREEEPREEHAYKQAHKRQGRAAVADARTPGDESERPGFMPPRVTPGLVLSCLLTVYTAVMSFEILFPFGLWVSEPDRLLNQTILRLLRYCAGCMMGMG